MTCNWLSKIREDVPINFLAIPGTHDTTSISGAFKTTLKKGVGIKSAILSTNVGTDVLPLTYAQRLSVKDQLDSGVRVLDMRVALAWYKGAEQILMCHGPAVFSTKLTDQLWIVKRWLIDNPTEFVAMIFQQQGAKSDDAVEKKRVTDLIMKKIKIVFTDSYRYELQEGANHWPTVGELRKKVMLFTRLETPVSGTIDVTAWNDASLDQMIGAEYQVAGTGLRIAIQDRFKEVTNTDFTDFLNKGWLRFLGTSQVFFNDVDEVNQAKFILFDRMRSQFNDDCTLKINHLSHSLKSPTYTQPYMLGTDLNEVLKNSIENEDARYRGFVMVDDAEATVCRSIVDSNVIFHNYR